MESYTRYILHKWSDLVSGRFAEFFFYIARFTALSNDKERKSRILTKNIPIISQKDTNWFKIDLLFTT